MDLASEDPPEEEQPLSDTEAELTDLEEGESLADTDAELTELRKEQNSPDDPNRDAR